MKKNKVITIFTLCIYFIYFIFNPYRYILWDQVEYGIDSFDFLTGELGPHTIRIGLIKIIYIIGDLLYFSELLSLNIFLNFLTLINVIFIYKILNRNNFISNSSLLLIPLPIIVSIFQNGRGIITTCGFLMLFYSLVYYSKKIKNIITFLFIFIISLIFLNASSGTFLVGILSILFYFILSVNRSIENRTNNFIIFMILFLLVLISPLIFIYITKNLDYYDGSIINMLNHGAGSIILVLGFEIITLFIFFISMNLFVIFFINKYFFSKYEFRFFLPFVIATLIGLLFGYTSFFVGIYINILYITLLINGQRNSA